MSKIHPTALVDKNAVIHDDVEIGAYSIVGPHVELGAKTFVGSHVNITGHTKIGQQNKIFPFVSMGEAPQHKKYNNEPTKLEIGNNNVVREFCTLHIATQQGTGITKIGNDNLFMAYVHIAHDCTVGNHTVFTNAVGLGGHVIIKDWVILGGYSIVHQFTIIGEHVMTAGGSVIAQDVPPYVLAFGDRAVPKGVNLEGLRRRGFSTKQIENIKHAYKILYKQGLSYVEAQNFIADLAINQPELSVFSDFFKQSTRGIIR